MSSDWFLKKLEGDGFVQKIDGEINW